MPDEELEVTEQTEEIDEAEAAFDEEASDEATEEVEGTDSEEGDGDQGEEEEEESSDAEEDDEEEVDEEKEEEPEEKTAQQKLEEAAEREEEEEEPEKEPETQPGAQAGPGQFTPDSLKGILSTDYKKLLPSGVVEVDGVRVDFDSYFDDFGEEAKAQQVVGQLIAENVVSNAVEQGFVVSTQKFDEVINMVGEEFRKISFDREVSAVHPSWAKTVRTDGFKKWIGNQGKKIQALQSSDEPDDGILVLDAYLEDEGKKKKEEADKKKNKAKKRKAGLYTKNTKASKSGTIEKDQSDAQAAFDED